MSNVDLNALKADVQMAQQTGRKMCSVHVDELTSLLMRADALAKVQDMIPMRVGYAYAEDVHLMMQGEKFRIGLQRKKGPRYSTEVLVYSLPSGKKKDAAVDLKDLIGADA